MAESLNNELTKIENEEWVDSLKWVIENESAERTRELLNLLSKTAGDHGIHPDTTKVTSEYINTIPPSEESDYPGDLEIEKRIYSAIRWNAMAIVAKANKQFEGIGGHISTYSSTSMLYEVGFQHFFRGYGQGKPDLVYFQGHAAPGLYARSFVEHRFGEKELESFRRELSGAKGLPSYPHPKALSDYWRFPTVSMGLGPIQAIYQARYLKYLMNRSLREKTGQQVWTFIGDGEMDEPESTGALSVAAREKLNNLIFVVNCNLQRLDGPVRGNGKMINELEGVFKGAGWKVIKVLWGQMWDQLFEKDTGDILKKLFNEMPDGELQRLAQFDGKGWREEFFSNNDQLQSLVEDFSDEELDELNRGGHDPVKIYNAYKFAKEYQGGPVVILAQTVKGYDQNDAGEASNVTHKTKKFNQEQLEVYRDTMDLPLSDKDLEKEIPFYRFDKKSAEFQYLDERRKELDGWLPERKKLAEKMKMPDAKIFKSYLAGSKDREVTTTIALVQLLTNLIKDKNCGQYIIPIVPDESRTFGMDSMFSKFGIYSSKDQQYEPVDKGSLLFYNEKKDGVIIEEGITEAGSMCSFIAAGTHHFAGDFYTVPFYIFYSMFGFQRIGDLIWAAADAGARGFLVGGIAGRTTLSGEGLQHADGQSHLYALSVPNLRAYDPCFAYELAVVIQDGLKKMYHDDQDIFYYLTITNQAYKMPAMPKGVEQGIIDGIYLFKKSRKRKNKKETVNLMGSGAIITEVMKAAEIMEDNYDIPVNIWSVTSYKALYDNARDIEWENQQKSKKKKNTIQDLLEGHGEVFIAATDYMKALPLTISQWIPGKFIALGTDGFGRSDTIPALRNYFGVSADHIVWHALAALSEENGLDKKILNDFRKKSKIEKDAVNPSQF